MGIRGITACGLLALSACGVQEDILLGDRLALDGTEIVQGADAATQTPALNLAAARSNASWTHAAGNAIKAPGHVSLASSLQNIWSVSVTEKEGRRHSITAPPVVTNGRIFVLGSRSDVTAVSETGALLWTRSLAPVTDNGGDASGGGLTAAGGQVFVSTGFGELVALDPASGTINWRHDTETTGVSAATYSDGILYATTRSGTAFAMDPDNGRILWEINGPQSRSNFAAGASPTITNKWALFPFGTGEVLSTFRKGGLRNWGAVVSGGRAGVSASTITDITGGPVVAGNRVFVGNTAGRMAALDLNTGERQWTAREGVQGNLIHSAGSLFAVNDLNELMRVSATSGDVLWRSQLPKHTRENPRKWDGIYAQYGPVLAGGRLIITSGDGIIRQFDPETGQLVASIATDEAAATAPSVANGTLYVLNTRGMLQAFR